MRGVRLHLVRHGATEWAPQGRWAGSTDLPLTAHGEAEAYERGKQLADLRVERILTSPLKRARDTAEIIRGASGIEWIPEIDHDLREADFGPFEGLNPDDPAATDEATERFRRHLRGEAIEGPEPLAVIAERGERALLRAARAGGSSLVIAHGTLTRLALCRILGMDLARFRSFELATAGLIELRGGPAGLRLRLG